jgi:hypothetical protein
VNALTPPTNNDNNNEITLPHRQMLDAGYDPLQMSMGLTKKVSNIFEAQYSIFQQETQEYFAQLKQHQTDPEVSRPTAPIPPINTAVALNKMLESQLKLIAPSAKPIDVVNTGGTNIQINIVNFDNVTKQPITPKDVIVDIPSEEV